MPDHILDALQPFAIALLIGLMTGIERERRQESQETILGMRTFALIALLGAIAAYLNILALTLSFSLLIITVVGLAYWRSSQERLDRGLTTEIAAGVVFGLGYMTIESPILAVILGIVLVAILFFRNRLHWFARDVLQPKEITTSILLLIFIFIVIPFFPDRTMDVWGLVNPRKLTQVVAMIAIIEFGAYVAKRIAGVKTGLLIAGLLGGFASSTAVFLNMAKNAKAHPEQGRALLGACLLAIVSPLLLFLMIVATISPDLLSLIGLPVFGAALTSCILGILIANKSAYQEEQTTEQKNPLDVVGVLKLGALISGLLILSALAQKHAGGDAIYLVSFVAGLFELHGITLANATLYASSDLAFLQAAQALMIALGASFASKIAICWVLAPGRFAVYATLAQVFIVSVGTAIYLWLQAG